jgi:mannosyltransferase OCH1-like enzyme
MKKSYIILFLIIFIFILSILTFIIPKYSNTNEKFQSKETDNKKIPKVIHMTYISYQNVPQKVWDNLKKFAPDYKILFYSDEACKDFLKKNYDKKIFNMYEKLRRGAHKADLFRYCCLYKLGGVYLDIKMKPEKMLNKIFNHNREGLLYTCINHDGKHIYQGLLASYPKNKIFLDLMDDFDNFNNDNYHYFTKSFMRIIKEKINKEPTIKYNKIDDDNYIYLFKEKNIQMNNEKKDRYGGYFSIYDGDERIMKTRYTDFPWKKTNNYKVNSKVIEV